MPFSKLTHMPEQLFSYNASTLKSKFVSLHWPDWQTWYTSSMRSDLPESDNSIFFPGRCIDAIQYCAVHIQLFNAILLMRVTQLAYYKYTQLVLNLVRRDCITLQ